MGDSVGYLFHKVPRGAPQYLRRLGTRKERSMIDIGLMILNGPFGGCKLMSAHLLPISGCNRSGLRCVCNRDIVALRFSRSRLSAACELQAVRQSQEKMASRVPADVVGVGCRSCTVSIQDTILKIKNSVFVYSCFLSVVRNRYLIVELQSGGRREWR